MSSFSRLVLVALLLFWARPALALNVLGVYRAACDRVMGVVVRVERRDVHVLDLTGHMVTVPRHEIVSLAYYPVPGLALDQLALGPAFPMFRVKALQGQRIVDLVEGWPVDYSEEKVSFLGRDGKDMVINRDSIWSMELVDTDGPQANPIAAADGVDYAHPQASGFCVAGQAGNGRHQIFPQQFLNDEVVIKRELDRLQEGYDKVEKYSHDQLFYAVPEVYRNQTSLGLWLSLGARHGASASRNNLTPLLTDELSLGPFGYQHVIMTGSAPNRLLMHEEPQTQLFYAFKAAYFHASVFFDPNLVLVGKKYDWRYSDLSDHRAIDRWVESLLIELGFDLGLFSLQIVPLSVGDIGMGGKLGYHLSRPNLWRVGPRVVSRFFQADVTVGTDTDAADDGRFVYVRANLDVPLSAKINVGWSGIYRSVRMSEGEDWWTPGGSAGAHDFASTTLVSSFRARLQIGRRALLDALLSVERAAGHFDNDPTDVNWFWKCGLAGSFRF